VLQSKLREAVNSVSPASIELDCLPDFSVISDVISQLQLHICPPAGFILCSQLMWIAYRCRNDVIVDTRGPIFKKS